MVTRCVVLFVTSRADNHFICVSQARSFLPPPCSQAQSRKDLHWTPQAALPLMAMPSVGSLVVMHNMMFQLVPQFYTGVSIILNGRKVVRVRVVTLSHCTLRPTT